MAKCESNSRVVEDEPSLIRMNPLRPRGRTGLLVGSYNYHLFNIDWQ